jgi:hypothetical protein
MLTAEHRKNASRKGLPYPSDLTEDEWRLVEPFIPHARHGGRRRKSRRHFLNSCQLQEQNHAQSKEPIIPIVLFS